MNSLDIYSPCNDNSNKKIKFLCVIPRTLANVIKSHISVLLTHHPEANSLHPFKNYAELKYRQ